MCVCVCVFTHACLCTCGLIPMCERGHAYVMVRLPQCPWGARGQPQVLFENEALVCPALFVYAVLATHELLGNLHLCLPAHCRTTGLQRDSSSLWDHCIIDELLNLGAVGFICGWRMRSTLLEGACFNHWVISTFLPVEVLHEDCLAPNGITDTIVLMALAKNQSLQSVCF